MPNARKTRDGRGSGDRRRDPVGPHAGHQSQLYREVPRRRSASIFARRAWCPTSRPKSWPALNALRARYDYVFTTGGIGPTHDDITADAVAKAFGVGIDYNPEALALLAARYKPGEFNEMRKRMARIPDGATLIKNSVSTAPGFQIGNVFVMAGVPMIMRAMLEESVAPRLQRGVVVISATIARQDRGGPHRGRACSNSGTSHRTRRHRQLSLLPRRRIRRAACGAGARGRFCGKRGSSRSRPPYARKG